VDAVVKAADVAKGTFYYHFQSIDEGRCCLGRPHAGVDLYRCSVEPRQVYVRDCMASGPREPTYTGSISAPVPPRRPPGNEPAVLKTPD
jgi:AcrR family transcriptional regulator